MLHFYGAEEWFILMIIILVIINCIFYIVTKKKNKIMIIPETSDSLSKLRKMREPHYRALNKINTIIRKNFYYIIPPHKQAGLINKANLKKSKKRIK